MPTLEFVVPAELGGAQECLLVTWLKQEGAPVKQDDPLVILQAEKISIEVPAPTDGVMGSILAKQGDVVALGQVLAYIEVQALPQQHPVAPVEVIPATPAPPAAEVRASPIAKRLAREHGIDLVQVWGTGEGGRITERDVQAVVEARAAAQAPPAPAPEETRASPVAKRIAREHGINLAEVPGTGGGGRITERDVWAAIEARQAGAGGTTPGPSPLSAGAVGSVESVGSATPAPTTPAPATAPLAGMRQAIARRMHESLQATAQLTLHMEADVTGLVARREKLKAAGGAESAVTYTDFIVRACARALRQHPALNVTLRGETIHYLPDIHIGLAVALDAGLVVPVIRHADRKALVELAAERVRFAARARAGQLTAEEMSGGTFTVTNLGAYDVDWFTPIVNLPEAAILGVGRIAEKVVIHQGRVAQRAMLGLSLTIDHRLIDGAPGAAFLQAVRADLEEPG
jgi:pyruvate dehydrogenase E2 component (dihydrolipoamide acetyltransferase)